MSLTARRSASARRGTFPEPRGRASNGGGPLTIVPRRARLHRTVRHAPASQAVATPRGRGAARIRDRRRHARAARRPRSRHGGPAWSRIPGTACPRLRAPRRCPGRRSAARLATDLSRATERRQRSRGDVGELQVREEPRDVPRGVDTERTGYPRRQVRELGLVVVDAGHDVRHDLDVHPVDALRALSSCEHGGHGRDATQRPIRLVAHALHIHAPHVDRARQVVEAFGGDVAVRDHDRVEPPLVREKRGVAHVLRLDDRLVVRERHSCAPVADRHAHHVGGRQVVEHAAVHGRATDLPVLTVPALHRAPDGADREREGARAVMEYRLLLDGVDRGGRHAAVGERDEHTALIAAYAANADTVDADAARVRAQLAADRLTLGMPEIRPVRLHVRSAPLPGRESYLVAPLRLGLIQRPVRCFEQLHGLLHEFAG
jgi:hypothetical protein